MILVLLDRMMKMAKSNEYWANRNAATTFKLLTKGVEETNAQLKKYYKDAMKKVLGNFEETYNKLLSDISDGREPTPADLYKLDKYWQAQNQLKTVLQELGDKQAAVMSKKFVEQWMNVYKGIALPTSDAFGNVDIAIAQQMINRIWCADGKTWSDRIWKNIDKLAETLNDELIHCVVSGKKTTELKNLLQERFNVSYNNADMLVRTELAHIQTQAAKQRYQDAGLTKYEFLGREEHDIGCKCKQLNGKQFFYSEMVEGVNAPPMHPRCRCGIIPVVEID